MKYVILSLIVMQAAAARADLDGSQTKALEETKQLLNSRAQRDQIFKKDANAKATDAKVEALVGSGAQKDAVYGVSADVMEKLTRQTNGDPAKMQEVLSEAMKNPEGFYNQYFDDSARARVRGVANSINQPATAPQD